MKHEQMSVNAMLDAKLLLLPVRLSHQPYAPLVLGVTALGAGAGAAPAIAWPTTCT